MTTMRIELNRSAVRDLLRSDAVAADLRARAERIATAAGEGMEVETEIGPERARAAVITMTHKARLAEAQDRALTSALDAGR